MKQYILGGTVVGTVVLAGWFIVSTVSPPAESNEVSSSVTHSPTTEPLDTLDATNTQRSLPQDTTDVDTSVVVPTPPTTSTPIEPATRTAQPITARIKGTPAHPASGTVSVITNGDGNQVIQYQQYQGTRGPDLYIYLATDLEATEFVSLGRAQGNNGTFTYVVPNGTDIKDYPYVLTWCQAFSELFDYAILNQ
jgi:hypothetical protein